MDRYAVITTGNNTVVNIVLWDGESQWGPGKGHTTVRLEDGQFCDIDAVYDKESGEFAFPDGYEKPVL